ncbi:MAG: hypothetical protein IKV54_00530 [Clostridia bacterium]|nr:hypothetical protein [Clostridia bacterium]
MKEKKSPAINENTIEKLCELAMLLPPESKNETIRDIEGLIDLLSPLDPLSVTEMCSGDKTKTVFREDIAVQSSKEGAVLSTAPDSSDGYLRVPRTVE